MLGWSLWAHQGGWVDIEIGELQDGSMYTRYKVIGGKVVDSIVRSRDLSLPEPIHEAAIEVVCEHGYPSIYKLRAKDYPHDDPYSKLEVPDDEIIIVEIWDES